MFRWYTTPDGPKSPPHKQKNAARREKLRCGNQGWSQRTPPHQLHTENYSFEPTKEKVCLDPSDSVGFERQKIGTRRERELDLAKEKGKKDPDWEYEQDKGRQLLSSAEFLLTQEELRDSYCRKKNSVTRWYWPRMRSGKTHWRQNMLVSWYKNVGKPNTRGHHAWPFNPWQLEAWWKR